MLTSKLSYRIGTIVILVMMTLGTVQPAYAAPSNDNFANAIVIRNLPYNTNIDFADATQETGEPLSECGFGSAPNSVWFAYTPSTAVTLIAESYYDYSILDIYTGTAVDNLKLISCQYFYPSIALQAQANTTYYFRLTTPYGGWRVPFSLRVAPPPNVYFYYDPYDPNVFDNVNFYADIGDPVDIYGGTPIWDLGDGTTSNQYYFTHQYAKDGDYTVNLSYKTSDGRTGSSSRTIQVRTRDVAITKFSVPQTAKSNTTKEITVEVTNRRYSDNVRVELYKGLPGGGEQLIGTLTIYVPARTTRSTLFRFSYTYTGCDAMLGKATFRTVATPMSGRDALPADNTAIRTTLVTGSGSCSPTSYP